jgi:quercetin dioxygenase-like cupin family protein
MRAIDVIRPTTQRRPAFARAVAATALGLAFLAGTGGLAQDEEPAARVPARNVLADELLSPTLKLLATELAIEPSVTTPAHRHSGTLFVYVLEGQIQSQIDDGPVVLYETGDSWVEPEGVVHTRADNPSDTDPVRLLIIRVMAPDAPLRLPLD